MALFITLLALPIIGSWMYTLFILPWPHHPMEMSMPHLGMQTSRFRLPARREYRFLDQVAFEKRPLVVTLDSLASTARRAAKRIVASEDYEEQLSANNDSKDYSKIRAEPFSDENCEVVPKNAQWMLTTFPTCNIFHEVEIFRNLMLDRTRMKSHGYWRDVWILPDTSTGNIQKTALKTLRYEHDYIDQNFERHRRDALAYDRLTSSPNVVDIYGYCGQSGLYQYSPDGTLSDRLEEHIMAAMDAEIDNRDNDNSTAMQLDPYQKLQIAHQVALALADVHDADALRDGAGKIISASIVHADTKADQFINFDGHYKLNDFNRCRFVRRTIDTSRNVGDGKPCGFTVDSNPSVYRSPEEYSYKEETEKIDIFSMGNIFYTLLADINPWDGVEEQIVQQMIIAGERPQLPESKAESNGFVDVILRELMNQCFMQDPIKRPSARTMANIVGEKIDSYE